VETRAANVLELKISHGLLQVPQTLRMSWSPNRATAGVPIEAPPNADRTACRYIDGLREPVSVGVIRINDTNACIVARHRDTTQRVITISDGSVGRISQRGCKNRQSNQYAGEPKNRFSIEQNFHRASLSNGRLLKMEPSNPQMSESIWESNFMIVIVTQSHAVKVFLHNALAHAI
jgi:hypothetical protein